MFWACIAQHTRMGCSPRVVSASHCWSFLGRHQISAYMHFRRQPSDRCWPKAARPLWRAVAGKADGLLSTQGGRRRRWRQNPKAAMSCNRTEVAQGAKSQTSRCFRLPSEEPSKTELHLPTVAALKVMETRQGKQGKEKTVSMVLQIKDTRKADSVVGALLPFPLRPLAALKVSCAF